MKPDYKKFNPNKFDPAIFGRVAVLMGGLHSERDISLMSGTASLEALLRQGIDAKGIDVDVDIASQLKEGNYDRVFIALHGPGGEDGVIQGLLESLRIPYTGSGVAASALAIDKYRSKYLWQGMGLPTAPFMHVDNHSNPKEVVAKLGLPIALKPVNDGSSLGVTKVEKIEQWEKAYKLARSYNTQVMAECWIEGTELTVGILGQETLPIIRITTPVGFYDYEAKYFTDTTGFHIPCGLSKADEPSVQALALKAFRALGATNFGRVDLIRDANGNDYLLEVNTIPGLTNHSLVPKAALAVGIDFDALILRILAFTL